MLVDFGLAGRKVRPGCASPFYGAPEVWVSEGAGPPAEPGPADVYSFCCLAFELFVGRRLFQGETLPAVVAAHFAHDGAPAGLGVLRTDRRFSSLVDALEAGLRADPRKRVAISEVRAELARVEPDAARGELAPERPPRGAWGTPLTPRPGSAALCAVHQDRRLAGFPRNFEGFEGPRLKIRLVPATLRAMARCAGPAIVAGVVLHAALFSSSPAGAQDSWLVAAEAGPSLVMNQAPRARYGPGGSAAVAGFMTMGEHALLGLRLRGATFSDGPGTEPADAGLGALSTLAVVTRLRPLTASREASRGGGFWIGARRRRHPDRRGSGG